MPRSRQKTNQLISITRPTLPRSHVREILDSIHSTTVFHNRERQMLLTMLTSISTDRKTQLHPGVPIVRPGTDSGHYCTVLHHRKSFTEPYCTIASHQLDIQWIFRYILCEFSEFSISDTVLIDNPGVNQVLTANPPHKGETITHHLNKICPYRHRL